MTTITVKRTARHNLGNYEHIENTVECPVIFDHPDEMEAAIAAADRLIWRLLAMRAPGAPVVAPRAAPAVEAPKAPAVVVAPEVAAVTEAPAPEVDEFVDVLVEAPEAPMGCADFLAAISGAKVDDLRGRILAANKQFDVARTRDVKPEDYAAYLRAVIEGLS